VRHPRPNARGRFLPVACVRCLALLRNDKRS